jgi:hypothetical protein
MEPIKSLIPNRWDRDALKVEEFYAFYQTPTVVKAVQPATGLTIFSVDVNTGQLLLWCQNEPKRCPQAFVDMLRAKATPFNC